MLERADVEGCQPEERCLDEELGGRISLYQPLGITRRMALQELIVWMLYVVASDATRPYLVHSLET